MATTPLVLASSEPSVVLSFASQGGVPENSQTFELGYDATKDVASFLSLSSNATFLVAGPAQMRVSADLLTLASGTRALVTAPGSEVQVGSSNVTVTVGGTQVLSVSKDASGPSRVRIVGDLQVTGVVDSVSITQTSLRIEDRFVQLAQPAAGSNSLTDAQVGSAGVTVNCEPPTIGSGPYPATPSERAQRLQEKSLLWNYADGGDTVDAESFWELRGGPLRISKIRSDGWQVSWGMRIAQRGELELYQVLVPPDGTPPKFRVVSRFGERA
jgi:hypothetical protein